MKAALVLILILVAIVLAAIAVRQSALLHHTEALRDGIQFIRVTAAKDWGTVPLPDSKPDVTGDAITAGIVPRDWANARDPFGHAFVIGRYRSGDLISGKASLSLTLFDLPASVCRKLLPRLREDVNAGKLLAVWLNGRSLAESDMDKKKCPANGAPTTLRLALATPAPPAQSVAPP